MEGGLDFNKPLNPTDPHAGIIPRAIHQIFTTLESSDTEYSVRVSFLELYNEELIDLLGTGNENTQQLKLFEDATRYYIYFILFFLLIII